MAQAGKRTLSRRPNHRTGDGQRHSLYNSLRRAFARAARGKFRASRGEGGLLRDSRSVRFRKTQTRCPCRVAKRGGNASFFIIEDRVATFPGLTLSFGFRKAEANQTPDAWRVADRFRARILRSGCLQT